MNQLLKRILVSPTMWIPATQVLIAKMIGRKEVVVKRDGLKIACGLAHGQGSYCAISGDYYEAELAWLLNQLRPQDVFVDVGANIGIYSLYAARTVGSSGLVISIEPSHGAFSLLQQNISLNGLTEIVTPLHAAASQTEGELFLTGDPTKWNSLQLKDSAGGVPVRVTTVDNALKDPAKRGDFRFLKIDAEGVETDVLEGAWSAIQVGWPAIIFENSINRSQQLPTDWLISRGYAIYCVDRNGRLQAVEVQDYSKSNNLVALHPRSRARKP